MGQKIKGPDRISYYNGTRWAFAWEDGRKLVSASSTGNTISYGYDLNGVRDSKTVNGVEHTYYYASGKLLRETYGTNTLDFMYDASGNPYILYYTNGSTTTTYYYISNLQGDVVRIVDTNGATVAQYHYDAWGSLITLSDSSSNGIGTINPLRYRGYYYDTETGFYYLQSRYYDPTIGRFINADVLASTGQGFLGYNTFAYCNNSPVNATDASGAVGIWFYLIQAMQLGLIHRAVQAHIVGTNPDIKMEKWVRNCSGNFYGRADLVSASGAVWEVKHAGSDILTRLARKAIACKQAKGYIGKAVVDGNITIVGLGAAHAFTGSFVIQINVEYYKVSYETLAEGVVLYSVEQIDGYDGIPYLAYEFDYATSELREINPATAPQPAYGYSHSGGGGGGFGFIVPPMIYIPHGGRNTNYALLTNACR